MHISDLNYKRQRQGGISLEKADRLTTPISLSSGWKLVSTGDLLVFYGGQSWIEQWRNPEKLHEINLDSV